MEIVFVRDDGEFKEGSIYYLPEAEALKFLRQGSAIDPHEFSPAEPDEE